jgi:ComF family protein
MLLPVGGAIRAGQRVGALLHESGSRTASADRPSRIARLAGELLEAVFPQRCLACGRFGAALHPWCLDDFAHADPPRCLRCWRPGAGTWCEVCATGGPDTLAFDGLRAPFRFEGAVRRGLLEAKFRAVTGNLAPLAVAAAEVVPATWTVDAVVPVPLARGRERRRGFNQAERIARTVARQLEVPIRTDLVRRVRETPAQAALSAERRRTNLRDAFEARLALRHVLVVDDVTTTGSTLSSVAAALKEAGAERVYALAIARED